MKKNKPLLFLTIAYSVMTFGLGLIGPFYVIYIEKIGGSITQLGFAFGIMLIVQAITNIFAGKLSDKIGRKSVLIGVVLVYALVVALYPSVTTLLQLYAIQIAFGIVAAFEDTTLTTFLGDITKKAKRGYEIGQYKTVVGLAGAVAIMIAGAGIDQYGFAVVFYASALLIVFSTIFLLKIKVK